MSNHTIKSEIRDGSQVFILCSEQAFAEIASQLGNNCFAFNTGHPVLDPVSFDDFVKDSKHYGMPFLFPFPNRIKDGKFLFRDDSYDVEPKQHGYVRDKPWKIVNSGASNDEGAWVRSSLSVKHYPTETLNKFPFEFRIEVTYRLKNATLEIETVVHNTGKNKMPAGFGLHPYFRRPARGSVQIPAQKRWELSDYIPTGNILDVSGRYDLRNAIDLSRIGEMDDIFTGLFPEPDGFIRCRLNDHDEQIQTIIEFDPADFHEIVLYTPKNRQAICIEPYSCPTDAFNLYARGIADHHVILLEPNGVVSFNARIYTRSLVSSE